MNAKDWLRVVGGLAVFVAAGAALVMRNSSASATDAVWVVVGAAGLLLGGLAALIAAIVAAVVMLNFVVGAFGNGVSRFQDYGATRWGWDGRWYRWFWRGVFAAVAVFAVVVGAKLLADSGGITGCDGHYTALPDRTVICVEP